MPSIQSDNAAVEACLRAMIDLIAQEGGFFHPQLRLSCESGNLTLHSGLAVDDRSLLLFIPAHCLPSADDFTFGFEGNVVTCEPASPTVPEPQVRLMQHLVTLYGETGKLDAHSRTCPWVALRSRSSLLNLLESARTNWASRSAPGKNLTWDTFCSTRNLSFFGDRKRVLVPVAEIANHHPFASGFVWESEAGKLGVGVRNCRLRPGSDEVFVWYAPMDVLDTYLRFDYVEPLEDTIKSMPLRIDLPGAGAMEIEARSIPVKPRLPAELPVALKDIAYFVPLYEMSEDRTVRLPWLLIPPASAPAALRRLLAFILQEYAGRFGVQLHLEGLVLDIESRVLSAKRDFLRAVRAERRRLPPDLAGTPAARNLGLVVDQESRLLTAYERRLGLTR